MANKDNYIIKIELDVTNDKAVQALIRQLQDASKVAPQAGKAFNKAGKSAGQFGNRAQNVGYQLQDLVVQIQGGTDASRALSQQLPQMLVGFGAWGAAVGVVTALLPTLIALTGDSSASAEAAAESYDAFAEALERFGETGKAVDAIIASVLGDRAMSDRVKAISDFRKEAEKLSNINKQGAARTASITSRFGSVADFDKYVSLISQLNNENIDETAAELGRLASGMKNFADPDTVKSIQDYVISLREFNVATEQKASDTWTDSAVAAYDYAAALDEIKDAEFSALQAAIERDRVADERRQKESAAAQEAERRKLRSTLQPVQASQGNADIDARYKAFMREEEALRKLGESYTLALNPLKAYEAELATLTELYNRNYISAETAAKGVEESAETYAKATEQFSISAELIDTFDKSFTTMLDGVLMGTQSLSQGFEDMAKVIIAQLLKLLAYKAVFAAFGIDLTGGAQFAADANAKGNAFSNGNVIPFANGGVVNSPTIFPMANGAAGLMGEAGPEAIMPLSRGTNGKLGVEAAPVNVVINNNAPGVAVQQRQTDSGLTIDIVMQQMTTAIRRGGNDLSNALEDSYTLGRGRAVY